MSVDDPTREGYVEVEPIQSRTETASREGVEVASAATPPSSVQSRDRRLKQPLIKDERFLRIACPAGVGVLFLLIWQMGVMAAGTPEYILPGPIRIGQALLEHWSQLLWSLLMTLKITFLAFGIAVGLGVLIALLFVQSKWLEISLFPYAVLMQVTPIVAIAPLIIIWVDNTTWALMICATIIAIFPMISNTTLGLRSVNPNLMSLFQMYQASRLQTLVRLRIPSSLPYFFGGLRISSGLSLIGAVVAEFVAGTGGSEAGLAYLILQSSYSLQIPRMFAALVLITLTGIVMFAIMVWLSQLTLRNWHESALEVEQ